MTQVPVRSPTPDEPGRATAAELRDRAVVFSCRGDSLVGILTPATAPASVGMVIVVGGPQYRAGSHRLFVDLAWAMGGSGVPAFRFDYRGIGDSDGEHPGFEAVAPDIRAAIDQIMAQAPTVRRVVLWGLCDAASAIALYAPTDPRVAGTILVNPWGRDAERAEDAQDDTLMRHYYRERVLSADFWRKVLGFNVNGLDFLRRLWRVAWRSATGGRAGAGTAEPLARRMLAALVAADLPALFVFSGDDLTAREFQTEAGRHSPLWARLCAAPTVHRHHIAAADHTFSDPVEAHRLVREVCTWVNKHLDLHRQDPASAANNTKGKNE